MKTILNIFGSLIVISLMIAGVFAESPRLSDEFQEFIKKISEKRGIKESEITNITKVDFNELPNEVNLENIDNTSLGIYEVNSKDKEPIFVITFSEGDFQKKSKPISYSTSLLNFGINGEYKDSSFMNTATGTTGSLENGYVMMRKGSITGISTSLEILEEGSENIEIMIYKNQELIGFRNTISSSSLGVKKDYDIQSKNIVTFNPGDIISVYIKSENTILKDIITLIEITTKN